VTDDLNVPQVPEPTAEDPEDVSWALSTAEAMWARGDHADGIKWVRRAAEAASEAENDSRALELAKAAADLMSLMGRMTEESIDLEEAPASEPAPVTAGRPPPPPAVKFSSPGPSSVTKQVVTPSRPPAPLPGRSSQSPPAPVIQKGKPLGTNTRPPAARAAGAKADKKDPPTLTVAGGGKKSGRKSRENLDAEARAAAALTAGVVEVPVAKDRIATPISSPPQSQSSPPVTVAAGMLPQNLGVGAAGTAGAMTNPSAPTASSGIITSQAVRVVVWRDGSGVHVAPAGTVVSAITVDAVLVALEPSTDLTAWLSPRKG
jgi:hypothetical protein